MAGKTAGGRRAASTWTRSGGAAMLVPFVGWSLAAERFRQLVAVEAKRPVSVLLIGEHGVASRYQIRLYLPPLRRRLIDILAVLHFYGKHFARRGCDTIDSALIHRLILDSSWIGNVASLVDYLGARASEGKAILGDDP